ncbi:hypothetical protein [Massilia sp. Root418]|jgi:hypothetical protein|uniref:hypothetical protein n=1 Tax=Massilia sp. Root418 TaxID=1736532 RepID=UPI000ABB2086|nr:hypothetical protein [Massilia sp. Root418]
MDTQATPIFARPARAAIAAIIACAGCSAAAAQSADAAPVATVTVPYTRDPVDKSYRKMVRGMERYERARTLAPRSSLRFQVLPRQPGVKLDGVALKVVGDSIALPVPMGPDHSFTLERNERAWREDAALVANRKTSSMTWRAMVRSIGVPPGMRRLGDLRLECLVGMEAGLVSNNSALFGWLSDMLADADKVCASPEGNYLQFADRPLFGVTLHANGRSVALPFRALYAGGTQTAATLPYCDCQVLLDRSYYAPIWDRAWPDDALLSFEYMDEAGPPVPPGVASKEAARAALGEPAAALRFDSGYEVWQYQYPPASGLPKGEDGRPRMAELVLLFDSAGTTLQYRRREP